MSEKHLHKEQYPLKHYRKLRKLVRRKKADVEESAENSFSIDAINDISQDEIVETDSEEDDTETDGFFLQPVPIRQRRSLLKLSGVKKVDSSEREECKELRENREVCGCDCKTVCDPETCLCAINGIQCQVDRFSFPCGCTKRGCGNPSGRIEFNPGKVRKHYNHTMKRLQAEYEQEESLIESPIQQRAAELGFTSLKRAKHIRFTDQEEVVEGEDNDVYLNSTETGCCLDCSLTAPPAAASCTMSECSDYAPFSVASSSPSLSEKLDSVADDSMFGTSSVFSSNDLALPSVSNMHSHSYSNKGTNVSLADSSHALEPISGLLNPILNTMDSLDMYALAHIHNQASSQSHAVADGSLVQLHHTEYTDDAVSEWQSLSHESMLTSNNLIPMNDDECSASSHESYLSSDDTALPAHDLSAVDNEKSVISFTSLKDSSNLSFQFQTSHNTAMHATQSQSEDMEKCNISLTSPESTTKANA